MHSIYPASLAVALYPHQAQSNRDRGANADGTAMMRPPELVFAVRILLERFALADHSGCWYSKAACLALIG
jgi:hypothetical protein